jgi:hypothetical protein
VADKSWIGKKPSKTDIVEMVVSKSFFHSHYKPLFSKVSKYPEMLAWLEGKGDKLSDIEVWGVKKSLYTFKDLQLWMEHGTLKAEMDVEEMDQGKKQGKKGKKDKDDKEKKKKVVKKNRSSK